jgi:hypothetical protein
VRLFGIEGSERNMTPRTEQTMASSLINKIPKLIPNFGYLFIVGYTKNDKLALDKLCDLLDLMREKNVIIFDKIGDMSDSEVADIAQDKEFSYRVWVQSTEQ